MPRQTRTRSRRAVASPRPCPRCRCLPACQQGVLTLALGPAGTYVINKQAPNREVWWSSPVSGPKRFYFDDASGRWLSTRDGQAMTDLLTAEIKALLGVDVELEH